MVWLLNFYGVMYADCVAEHLTRPDFPTSFIKNGALHKENNMSVANQSQAFFAAMHKIVDRAQFFAKNARIIKHLIFNTSRDAGVIKGLDAIFFVCCSKSVFRRRNAASMAAPCIEAQLL
ncbi:MAG TPA: hypothetical protein VF928_06200 [Usitatibacteraceae bacterium]